MLKIENLSIVYGTRRVLSGVSLAVAEGSLTAVIGPNGAGKSSFMRAVLGLIPHGGRIFLNGADLASLDRRDVARTVSYLPQDSSVRSALNVLEVVLLGRLESLGWHPPASELEAAYEALESLGLAEFANRRIGELSGGQRQMVFVAQALARGPRLLLLDEPTSALDVRHQLEILETIRTIARRQRLAVVIAVHDLNLAARFVDQVVILDGGLVHAAGTPASVMTAEMLADVFGIEAAMIHLPDSMTGFLPLRALPSGYRTDPQFLQEQTRSKRC